MRPGTRRRRRRRRRRHAAVSCVSWGPPLTRSLPPHPAGAQIQRLPGLPSSFVALDTIMNEVRRRRTAPTTRPPALAHPSSNRPHTQDNFITFEDTLGDPFEAPTEPMFKLHDVMEIKLGML